MCFTHDYDWYAETQEQSTFIADKPVKCNECRVEIPVGGNVYRIWQAEYEGCQLCENKYCECEPDRCCDCEEPDYGETNEHQCCENCHKFLQAVEASEVEEGCERSEARPALFCMIEDIRQFDDYDYRNRKRYIQKAIEMFPEMVGNGYIKRLWKKMT